ncbi:MAG: DUF4179 domain-containing protein [Clostridia bacterium]|nr:DUF4179 domain-containing protein [Clostridia bacterium]
MKNFINELHKLTPDQLPGIEPVKLSEKQIERITSRAKARIADADRIQKPCRRPVFRRAAAIAAAAVLTAVMSTTVFAYRDALAETGRIILDFFTREEEIIDPKSEMIHASAVESGITLEAVKAVRDGDNTYLYVTLTSHDGDFPAGLITCESYTLYKTGEAVPVTPKNGYGVMTERKLGITGLQAGDIFADLRDCRTDAIELYLPVRITGEGEYRLTVDHLISVTEEMQSGCYTGNLLSELLAEELTVDFTIDSELEPLDRAVIECDSEFTVSGVTLKLDCITVTPLEIIVDIRDELGETIAVEGWNTPELDCLGHYSMLYNSLLADMPYDADAARELYTQIRPKDFYNVKIAFTDDRLTVDEQNSYWGHSFASDPGLFRQTFRTDTPVYPVEIARIWLENVSDQNDVIVIWDK